MQHSQTALHGIRYFGGCRNRYRRYEKVKEVTEWVAGLSKEMGGSGDPSRATAHGVAWEMRACLEAVYDSDPFRDKTIAIQGIAGKVGSILARDNSWRNLWAILCPTEARGADKPPTYSPIRHTHAKRNRSN